MPDHQQPQTGDDAGDAKAPENLGSTESSKPVRRRTSTRSRSTRPIVGWREWAVLPLLADEAIKVKIDTGAATSSLHAHDLDIFEVANDLDLDEGPGSLTIARFAVYPGNGNARRNRQGSGVNDAGPVVEIPIVAFRTVKSSNGQSELRPVVRTPIVLGSRQFDIDLTLADRDTMGYRMLLGRRAIRRRFLVDPGKSYLLGQPGDLDKAVDTDSDQQREQQTA